MEKSGIKIEGHKGKWYVIDEGYDYKNMRKIYLLEHETYGDEAPCLIIDGDLKVIMDDVYNGFNDLDN